MALLSRQLAYTKIKTEDPEEITHRKVQFLIRKTLEKVDAISRPRLHSLRGLRLCLLKVEIGKRLQKPRKRVAAMFKKISRRVKYLEALIW